MVFAFAVGQINAHRLRSDFDAQVSDERQQFAATSHRSGCATRRRHAAASRIHGAVRRRARVLDLDGEPWSAPTPQRPNLGSRLTRAARCDQTATNVQRLPGRRPIPVDFGGGRQRGYLQYAPAARLLEQRDRRAAADSVPRGADRHRAGLRRRLARRAPRDLPGRPADRGRRRIERTGDPTHPSRADRRRRDRGALTHAERRCSHPSAPPATRPRPPRAPARLRRRRLTRAAHAADQRPRQPRAAGRLPPRSRPRRRRLGAALDPADAPPRRRSAAARAGRRRAARSRRDRLDLADVVVDAAGELEPASGDHSSSSTSSRRRCSAAATTSQRVATNLIENALRHTPPGSHVTASARPLRDGGAELVVADDGPGIAPDARATLFDRFVRGAGDRGGSFGLGLAIVAAVDPRPRRHGHRRRLPPRRGPLHGPPAGAGRDMPTALPSRSRPNRSSPSFGRTGPRPDRAARLRRPVATGLSRSIGGRTMPMLSRHVRRRPLTTPEAPVDTGASTSVELLTRATLQPRHEVGPPTT